MRAVNDGKPAVVKALVVEFGRAAWSAGVDCAFGEAQLINTRVIQLHACVSTARVAICESCLELVLADVRHVVLVDGGGGRNLGHGRLARDPELLEDSVHRRRRLVLEVNLLLHLKARGVLPHEHVKFAGHALQRDTQVRVGLKLLHKFGEPGLPVDLSPGVADAKIDGRMRGLREIGRAGGHKAQRKADNQLGRHVCWA